MATHFYSPPRPRRKKRLHDQPTRDQKSSQGDIPIVGVVLSGRVWVSDPTSIEDLVSNGCYGNKVLPRSRKEAMDESLLDQIEGSYQTKSELDPTPRKKPQQEEKQMIKEKQEEISSVCSTHLLIHSIITNMAKNLYLFPEEAFYLLQHTRLKLIDKDGITFSLVSLWNEFLKYDKRFPEKYIAYFHFRRQGWVPKCGLKFGVDFLLYKINPSVYHSSYAVLVTKTTEDVDQKKIKERECENSQEIKPTEGNITEESFQEKPVAGLSWQQVISIGRVNEGANKEVLICSVVVPQCFMSTTPQEDDFEQLLYQISDIKITCTVVKRWIAEKGRD